MLRVGVRVWLFDDHGIKWAFRPPLAPSRLHPPTHTLSLTCTSTTTKAAVSDNHRHVFCEAADSLCDSCILALANCKARSAGVVHDAFLLFGVESLH